MQAYSFSFSNICAQVISQAGKTGNFFTSLDDDNFTLLQTWIKKERKQAN